MNDFRKDEWRANRGSGKVIKFSLNNEQLFNEDDSLRLSIYNKNGFTETPLLTKVATISENFKTATIELTNTDMEFDEPYNKTKEYWYDIKLNGSTIIGADEDGPKILYLYPEGSED